MDYVVDKNVFNYSGGYVPVSPAEGLGIEVDEAMVREKAKIGHHWKNDVWRNADGTAAEW
jgi:galactonate dehydratase